MHQTGREVMKLLSGGTIDDRLLNFRTEKELCNLLRECGVDWNDIDNCERYGMCLQLRKQDNKIFLDQLSEKFDARESQRYLDFFFG